MLIFSAMFGSLSCKVTQCLHITGVALAAYEVYDYTLAQLKPEPACRTGSSTVVRSYVGRVMTDFT